jgi:hypothetical protein
MLKTQHEYNNKGNEPEVQVKTQHQYSNRGYEPEENDDNRQSTPDSENRASVVSYDDITFDLK